jgi:hypothetical protein
MDFQDMSWDDLTQNILLLSADFNFKIYLFFMAKNNISFQFSIMLLSMCSVSILFYIFYQATKKITSHYLLLFLIIFFTISFMQLFSGVRYYLACSIVFLSFYYGYYKKNATLSLLLLLFASCTHFSMLVFILVYFLVLILRDKPFLAKICFISSLSFLLIPKLFIFQVLSSIGILSGAFLEKIDFYLVQEDFIENSSRNSQIIDVITKLWIYFTYAYLIFTIKKHTLLKTILYSTIFICNIFYQTPTIFGRYIMVLQFFVSLFLIEEYIQTRKIGILYITCFLFSFKIFSQVFVTMRSAIISSYFDGNIILLITALLKRITYQDFIRGY